MASVLNVLVVVIAAINFVNFAVALTPLRIKGINTQKVLGCSVSRLRINLIAESLIITLLAFMLALFWSWSLEESHGLDDLLGPALSLGGNISLIVLTGLLAVAVGLLAGLYPAWHMSSVPPPPALVLNGSFAVAGRAKVVRKGLIAVQYVISIVRIVGISFVVAAPLAWYGVRTWLQSFAYKTPIHAWVFLIALMSVLMLTILTVTFQSYRAATTNPARSLHR